MFKKWRQIESIFSLRFAILQQQANVRKCSLNCQIGQGGEMTIFGGGRESICSQMDKILNGSTTTTFTEASPPLRRHTCARIFREMIFTKYFAKLIFTKNYYLLQISNM